MKRNHRNAVQVVGGSFMLLTLLTACPRPYPPPPPLDYKSVNLGFRFPETAQTGNLTLAAIYFEEVTDPQTKEKTVKPKVLTTGGLGLDGNFSYPGGPNTGTGTGNGTGNGAGNSVNGGALRLDSYALEPLKTNTACLTPFKEGEATGFINVTVTPDTVKTCNVYFKVFRDANRDGVPTRDEEVFITHDVYGYADTAFTYSMTSTDDKAVERGTRVQGWSLVRHEVLQPAATPGEYRVTMNSVPAADEGLTIRMHEDTNPLISQGGLK